MITERRLHSRKIPTEFTFIQIEQEFGGRVLNYSKEGLSFETSAPICNSDLVQFWLSFQRHGQVDGVGRIAWLNEKEKLGGIAFVHLSRASRLKIDEWIDAVPAHEGGRAGDNSKDEESPQGVVSEIMEQVLRDRRKSPATARSPVSRAEGANAEAAAAQVQEVEHTKGSEPASSAVVTPPKLGALDLPITNTAAVTMPREPQLADTCTSAAALTLAATTEECVDSANTDRAATSGARRLDSSEGPNSSLPPFFTPVTPETFDLWSTTGSGETTPALNPAAPSALGVEAEQINDAVAVVENRLRGDLERPASPSLATTTSIEQTNPPRNPDSSSEQTTELVPLRQYRYARRAQFLRGAAIGIGFSAVMTIAVFTFWKPAERGALAEGTRNPVSANSMIPKQDTVPVPDSSSGLTRKSEGSGLSNKRQNTISPGRSPVVRPDSTAAGEPSLTSGEISGPNAAPLSGNGSPDTPTNAIPRPSSLAYRDSGTNAFQPLFELSQPGNFDGWNGQPKVEVSLGSTPWTFRRRNIHGTPPVGGQVRPPELIAHVAPRYPEVARTQHISGEVVIDAVIDTQGNVRNAQIVSGPIPFRSAAVNAVLMWKYKPALLDGKPTETHETITLKFVAK
jgi:TonB family protein